MPLARRKKKPETVAANPGEQFVQIVSTSPLVTTVGGVNPGQVCAVPDDIAKSMIDSGNAVPAVMAPEASESETDLAADAVEAVKDIAAKVETDPEVARLVELSRVTVFALNGIGKVVQGLTWFASKTNRIFAGVTDAAATLHVAIARLNPLSDMDKVRETASSMRDAANDMRSFADAYEAVSTALGEENFGDRVLRNFTEINAESKGFAQNVRDAATLQKELGRHTEMQRTAGADRFEQVVRSRIAIGGQRSGRNYGQMTIDRLDRLIEVASGPKLALAK